MNEIERLKVKKDNGEIAEAEVWLDFKMKNDPTRYIIYTFHEVDKKGLTSLLVSRVEMLEDGYVRLYAVEDENVWKKIKDIMRTIINSETEV